MSGIAAVVHEICRHIERHADSPLPLTALAQKAGYSPAHLQRRFTALIGCSPKAYQAAIRQRHLKQSLKEQQRLGEAIYGAGFGSPSRVYENLDGTLGMTPQQYRRRGAGLTIHYAAAKTPLGWLRLAATARGLCLVQLTNGQAGLLEALKREFPLATLKPMPPAQRSLFAAWMRSLKAYLAGKRPMALKLPLDIRGTAFQKMVWDYLQTIPAGEVRSYRAVAAAIGRPKAVRAVASACARNRVVLVIPCHRVISASGALGGYRWGLRRKQRLLALEQPARRPRS